jgi:hypothetical protein
MNQINKNMLNKLKENFQELKIDMSNEQINQLITICKEDLITRFNEYSDENLYQLSLSTIKLFWCRFIKQYSNNPLNEILDCDSIINDETEKIKIIMNYE